MPRLARTTRRCAGPNETRLLRAEGCGLLFAGEQGAQVGPDADVLAAIRTCDAQFRKDVIFGYQGLYQQLCFYHVPLTYVVTTLVHTRFASHVMSRRGRAG